MMNKAQVVKVVRETALKADPKMLREDLRQKVFNRLIIGTTLATYLMGMCYQDFRLAKLTCWFMITMLDLRS